ncbi:MAG: CpsD/CapB family tyrosine-protein kinase [Acidobacteriaceae bacterium]
MSHIYEALQRAEAERKAGGPGVATTMEPEHQSMAFAPAAPVVEEARVTEQVRAAAVPSPLHEASVPASSPVLDPSFLSHVQRRPWNPSLERLPALHRGGVEVEQFRSLRSRVQEFRDLKKLKSVLVSSGLPQEGKSFIAANLAINLARHKSSKVLLIDGDMRCSSLHHYLGSDFYPGLPDYLSGKASLLEVMQYPEESADREPAMNAVLNNIAFIPGGDGGDMAADLSVSKRFDELLKTVEPYFDWIIIDSPPVLLVSDAVNLARSSDAVLLVARSGVTTFPVAQRAQQELKAANVIGFVLNAVEKPPMSGSYYYRYENKIN